MPDNQEVTLPVILRPPCTKQPWPKSRQKHNKQRLKNRKILIYEENNHPFMGQLHEKISIFANGFGEKSGACRKAFEL